MKLFYWLALIGALVAIVFAETFPFYVQACGPCMLLADLSALLQPFVLALFSVRVMVVLNEWWPDKECLNLGRDAAVFVLCSGYCFWLLHWGPYDPHSSGLFILLFFSVGAHQHPRKSVREKNSLKAF